MLCRIHFSVKPALCAATCMLAGLIAVQATTSAPGPAPAVPPSSATMALGKSIKQGMAYAELRKQLLGAGWLPLRDPQCWQDIGGEAAICNQMPEVQSCNSGQCIVRFANKEQSAQIRITTKRPQGSENLSTDAAQSSVQAWDFSGVARAPDASTVACPARDFNTFLKAFASEKRVQRAFVAPLVKVAELRSDDSGDHVQQVYEAAPDYRGFNVDFAGGAFHFVNDEGKVDPSPLRLSISERGPQARVVSYLYGMSEGNSYRFEDKDGCWYLTEDPQPPSS